MKGYYIVKSWTGDSRLSLFTMRCPLEMSRLTFPSLLLQQFELLVCSVLPLLTIHDSLEIHWLTVASLLAPLLESLTSGLKAAYYKRPFRDTSIDNSLIAATIIWVVSPQSKTLQCNILSIWIDWQHQDYRNHSLSHSNPVLRLLTNQYLTEIDRLLIPSLLLPSLQTWVSSPTTTL